MAAGIETRAPAGEAGRWPGWSPALLAALAPLAGRYVWWKTPAEALVEVLRHAQAGQFGERAWASWHYRLGLAALERVPPLPRRTFG